jgi:hypothetical protein
VLAISKGGSFPAENPHFVNGAAPPYLLRDLLRGCADNMEVSSTRLHCTLYCSPRGQWGADVFNREVVERSVRVIHWIESKVFVKS